MQTDQTTSTSGIRCMLMRGGTSKAGYFLAEDLPADPATRDELLLRIMGSPDPRQIDGIGGGHPLTSKVAIISPSPDAEADIDYLFLQVTPDSSTVSSRQNCGNILAGVGPFAVERGLVSPGNERTSLRIRMLNTGGTAVAEFATPDGVMNYQGDQSIDGVPGTAAAISLTFLDTAGSSTGALLPTGNPIDEIEGVSVSCVDNGMPSVMLRAADLGLIGDESPEELEANIALKDTLEKIRLIAGEKMGLGDVRTQTIPKMVLLSPARHGGEVTTRSFIPHRCHTSIGILGATTVAAALCLDGTVGSEFRQGDGDVLRIEHPSGYLDVGVAWDETRENLVASSLLRTARKLFDGTVFARP